MPSGAKKRKAARKKRVNQASISTSSALSSGEQDLKTVDEKDSDVGSVSSIASQDNNPQHHDEEVEKREDTSGVRSNVSENLHGGNGENKLKSEEDFESKNVIVIEWEKELHDDDSSSQSRSSGSTSSDDEQSRVLDKKIVSVETDLVNPVNTVTEVDNSLVKKEEEVVVTTSNKNPDSSSLDAKVSKSETRVDEDRSLLSIDDSKVGTSNDEEHVKISETDDCSIEQPLLASAPQPVQTTSWKGCCGLFELFSGSNR
jgi:hypothetical protein